MFCELVMSTYYFHYFAPWRMFNSGSWANMFGKHCTWRVQSESLGLQWLLVNSLIINITFICKLLFLPLLIVSTENRQECCSFSKHMCFHPNVFGWAGKVKKSIFIGSIRISLLLHFTEVKQQNTSSIVHRETNISHI